MPVHLFHHNFRRGGGMERYALVLARALRQLGYRVMFHARRADPALAQELGVDLDVLSVPAFPRKLQDYRFFRQANRRRQQLDGGAQIALTRVRARDVAICGGTHRGYLARARKLPGPFDLLQIWMEAQAYRSARMVVSHSNLCRSELIGRYGVAPEKIVTLYPPVDEEFAASPDGPGRAQERAKWGLPVDKVVFLFPSTGHRRKGLAPICHALQGFADQVVLAVAGGRPNGSTQPFLKYLGYVEDMASAYRAADFTILGSSYEPFGLVGPESVQCGTRLVFEQNIGCLEALSSDCAFTFSVRDAESIGRAVSAAVNLARQGQHRLANPAGAIQYDSRPVHHAEALLRIATSAAEPRPTWDRRALNAGHHC